MQGLEPQIERELVRRAAEGDRDAFETLWSEYQPRLLRYIGSIGLSDAEDVASQAWLEVFSRLETLDSREAGFRRLLFTVARRRMIDEVRKAGRLTQAEAVDQVASPEAGYIDLQGAVDLLRRLPAAQAEVVALRVVAGFSAAEVGEITGQSEGAVRAMGHRALRSLQAKLTAEAALDIETEAAALRDGAGVSEPGPISPMSVAP